MSTTELLTALINKVLKFSRLFPQDQNQDFFVLEAPRDQAVGFEDYITGTFNAKSAATLAAHLRVIQDHLLQFGLQQGSKHNH